MFRSLTRGSRLLAGALAFALALVAPATCLAAVVQMPEGLSPPCCHAGKECDDDALAARTDCCAVQGADVALRENGAKVVAPTASVLAPVVPALVALISTPVSFDPDVSRPPGSPTYLLISVFRL
jgi:hypothetical protein